MSACSLKVSKELSEYYIDAQLQVELDIFGRQSRMMICRIPYIGLASGLNVSFETCRVSWSLGFKFSDLILCTVSDEGWVDWFGIVSFYRSLLSWQQRESN